MFRARQIRRALLLEHSTRQKQGRTAKRLRGHYGDCQTNRLEISFDDHLEREEYFAANRVGLVALRVRAVRDRARRSDCRFVQRELEENERQQKVGHYAR